VIFVHGIRARLAAALGLTGLFLAQLVAVPSAMGATPQMFVVLYKQQAAPADAKATVQRAGGTLVAVYSQIGVVIAQSSSTSFRENLLADSRIEGAAPTSRFATRVARDQAASDAAPSDDLLSAPATDNDSLSPLQWDMRQIMTPQAHAITGGSRSVLVGDIDTGIDFDHPDLRANIDVANSASCVGGVADPGLAAQDDFGHGTHTAGIIAAASNGIGIVGVAPNVRIAAIKASDEDGYFYPEAIICAFVWAATHDFDVTNNSYFADPYLFNCRNDPVQHAIWKAEKRAIQYAQQRGVTIVATVGDGGEDLAHPTFDVTSPTDTDPVVRAITNACVMIPVEMPGVIGVSGVSNRLQDRTDPTSGYLKSFMSNVGVGVTDVTAPGGDGTWGKTSQASNGRVLSTWPSYIPCSASRRVKEGGTVYCYQQGAAYAAPHVAGVAALIISENPSIRPAQVKALIDKTADAQTCPATLPGGYDEFLGTESGTFAACQGGAGNNSWYGKGQVNALNAVSGN
jgi:lantibiotic leader peptide-processing serine protease